MYILTVLGTENLKDVNPDLMFDRKNQNEFVVNAEKKMYRTVCPKYIMVLISLCRRR